MLITISKTSTSKAWGQSQNLFTLDALQEQRSKRGFLNVRKHTDRGIRYTISNRQGIQEKKDTFPVSADSMCMI